jgi:contractile injection system tube protein
MTLTHAELINADTNERVACQFNPNEVAISKSNQWAAEKSTGTTLPDVHFKGEGASTLTLSLVFDSYEKRQDVRDQTKKVLALMSGSVGETDAKNHKHQRPPHVMFTWGKFSTFPAVVTQVGQKFTLFLENGLPARATLSVTLQEVPEKAAKKSQQGQNPTSRAAGASRVRVVQMGDTIDLIAADELGDPGAWRRVAETNDLEDPRRLKPGQALLIPPEL